MESAFRNSVKYAAALGRVQKMMVGGGCTISSESAKVERLEFDFLEWSESRFFLFDADPLPALLGGRDLTFSGGARRRWTTLAGGLHNR
jgi:hypothetical protein